MTYEYTYEAISTMKIMSVSISHKTFLLPLCDFSFTTLPTRDQFSVAIDWLAISRVFYTWNDTVLIHFCLPSCHTAWLFWDPFMLQCVSGVPSFYYRVVFHRTEFINSSINLWVVSSFCLLQMKLLWVITYIFVRT